MKNKTYALLLLACTTIISACNKSNDKETIHASGNYLVTGYISGYCATPCSYFYLDQNDQLMASGAVQDYTDSLDFNTQCTAAQHALVVSIQASIPNTLYSLNNQNFGCPNCHDQGGYYLTVSKNNQLYKWRIDPDIIDSTNHFLRPLALQLRTLYAQLPH